jgi:DNA-3-methyladenine glycosylase
MIAELKNLSAVEAAPLLLGWILERTLENGQVISGRIVETESYHQDDPAAHSYRGKTPRNSVMFGPAGHAYVYFTYGMHYCLNVVTGPEGRAEAVLIRALEPLDGIEQMQEYRSLALRHEQLANGPAKLTQALAIGASFNGHKLSELPLRLLSRPAVSESDIVRTTRIGISRAQEALERYYIRGNVHVSKL